MRPAFAFANCRSRPNACCGARTASNAGSRRRSRAVPPVSPRSRAVARRHGSSACSALRGRRHRRRRLPCRYRADRTTRCIGLFAGTIESGRQLAALGDCAVCHTVGERLPTPAAVPLPTPFGTDLLDQHHARCRNRHRRVVLCGVRACDARGHRSRRPQSLSGLSVRALHQGERRGHAGALRLPDERSRRCAAATPATTLPSRSTSVR